MWIYLCSICAREQSVGGAWVAFPARSSNPELVCLFVCLFVWLLVCLVACLLDYFKIYTFDMHNLFGSFSRNTCGYNLRCCWDSHSWSQTSHHPHPALWDCQINQSMHYFSNSPIIGTVLLKMWSFSCKWKRIPCSNISGDQNGSFPSLELIQHPLSGKICIFNSLLLWLPKQMKNTKACLQIQKKNTNTEILSLGLLLVPINAIFCF